MIIVVIGQSGAGKTSFVKRELLPEPYEIEQRAIQVTRAANGVYAIGKYGIGIRTEGTDTLPYNAQNDILKTIKELAGEGHDVVAEGDRINNRTAITAILNFGHPVKLYLLTCSLRTSMERLRKAGSKITIPFIKATKTKSKKIYFEFAQQANGEIVSTEGKNEHSDDEGQRP